MIQAIYFEDGKWGRSSSVSTTSSGVVSVIYPCDHSWKRISLRGTNRNQRVETVECSRCAERERRVWKDIHDKLPSKTYGLAHCYRSRTKGKAA